MKTDKNFGFRGKLGLCRNLKKKSSKYQKKKCRQKKNTKKSVCVFPCGHIDMRACTHTPHVKHMHTWLHIIQIQSA